jgi:hypothetical protein
VRFPFAAFAAFLMFFLAVDRCLFDAMFVSVLGSGSTCPSAFVRPREFASSDAERDGQAPRADLRLQ